MLITVIGRYIFNNFQQALGIRREYTAVLANLSQDLQLTGEEVDQLISEEASFLVSLKSEPPVEMLKVEYVQELDKLWLAQ